MSFVKEVLWTRVRLPSCPPFILILVFQMKNAILALCIPFLLISCQEEKPQETTKIIEQAPVLKTPGPLDDNPFIKKPVAPAVSNSGFQNPTFQEATEIKMNDTWTVYIWRDVPNNVTCYFYCVKDTPQNGISCVKN